MYDLPQLLLKVIAKSKANAWEGKNRNRHMEKKSRENVRPTLIHQRKQQNIGGNNKFIAIMLFLRRWINFN